MSSLTTELVKQTVQWFSDNTSTTIIIEVGSSKPNLQLVAIFDLCIAYNKKLIPSWMPEEFNNNKQIIYHNVMILIIGGATAKKKIGVAKKMNFIII